jgi:site-specific DNA-cytosine methylase
MSKFNLDDFLEGEETEAQQLYLFDERVLHQVRAQSPPKKTRVPRSKLRLPSKRAPLSTVDLGAGAGLLSFAFFVEGFRITEACEMDPEALASLDENFNHILNGGFTPWNFPGRQLPGQNAPFVKVDILDIPDKELIERGIRPFERDPVGPGGLQFTMKDWEGFGRHVRGKRSDTEACDANHWVPDVPKEGIDLFIGGPPCQPYSGMGHGKGEWDQRDLFPQIPRIVSHIQPRVVVMENVAVALSPRHKAWFDAWWKLMDEVGYEGTTWKLKAADYGSPQLRERAWFVAWPKGAAWGKALRRPPPPTHAHPKKAKAMGLAPWESGFQRLHQGCCMGYGLTSCINLNNLYGNCAMTSDVSRMKGKFPVYSRGWEGVCTWGSHYRPDETNDIAVSWKTLTQGMKDFLHNSATLLKMKPLDFAGLVMEEDPDKVGVRGTGWLAPAPCHRSFASRVGAGLSVMTGKRTGPRKRKWTKKEIEGLRLTELSTFKKLMDLPVWYTLESPDPTHNYGQLGNGVPVQLGRAVARHVWRALGRKVLPDPRQAGLWPIISSDFGGGCNPAYAVDPYEFASGERKDLEGGGMLSPYVPSPAVLALGKALEERGLGSGVSGLYTVREVPVGKKKRDPNVVPFGPVENVYWYMPKGWEFITNVIDPVFSGRPPDTVMVQFTKGKKRYKVTGMSFRDEMEGHPDESPPTFLGDELPALHLSNSPLEVHWLILEEKKGRTWRETWRRGLPSLDHALMEFAFLEEIR